MPRKLTEEYVPLRRRDHPAGFRPTGPLPRGSKYKLIKGMTTVVCSGIPSLATTS